jgi:NADPH:quinone reductase-like Zn-dependent oxidoreductase
VDDAAEILQAVKLRFPKVREPKQQDICYATQNRQDAVKLMAPQIDVLVVVGSPTSSNSNRLRELGSRMGADSYMIDSAEELQNEWFVGKHRVGLTAGASAFGKFAIHMAKAKGIRVAATVRHESQKQLLLDLGAELVINTTTEKLAKVIFEKTEVGVNVVFDAVGGELGVKALSCLKQKGRMMVFGALALENLSINSGLLIFKNLRIDGFWLSTWVEELPAEQRMKAFQGVFGFLMQDDSKVDVAATYPLSEFKAALDAYEQAGRNGKILLISE